jgi:fructose-bisphosphate aldolase, class II
MNYSKGVIFGPELKDLYRDLKKQGCAIPAVNVTGNNTINASLATAKEKNKPIIIQMSHSGAAFIAGKSLDNSQHQASTKGAIIAALHVHNLARLYDVTVILHTDHADKDKLGWIDGLLQENQKYYGKNNRPLFSSHMLDLSALPLKENIEICQKYLQKMDKLQIALELEIGITGGEEDGIDNSDQDESKLYTNPQDVAFAYSELMPISQNFSIAASFGNVHGVYKPGNVVLRPSILQKCQQYIAQKFGTQDKPLDLVFHGGSGSEIEKIKQAVSHGVVKFNIDTDIQWAFWDGVKNYESKNHDYLQTQLGNPKGQDEPNKEYYDPRKWLYAGEQSIKDRLVKAYEELVS